MADGELDETLSDKLVRKEDGGVPSFELLDLTEELRLLPLVRMDEEVEDETESLSSLRILLDRTMLSRLLS